MIILPVNIIVLMLKTYKSILSKYSLVRPSFREGVLKILDIYGNCSNYKITRKDSIKSDYETLHSDWKNVGSYFCHSSKTL